MWLILKGMIFGAIAIPLTFAAFLLTIFIIGLIACGLLWFAILIYSKLK